jgi:HAD superfamily hydrolase (TIGR01509 family)
MDRPEALLWDVDGTIAETERDGHRVAFNLAFEAFRLPWRWDDVRYGELLRVAGGRERLLHDIENRPDAPRGADERAALALALHEKKNSIYAELMSDSGIPLRGGVLELMQECRDEGVPIAIATTTSRSNVAVLLSRHLGPRWREWFGEIVCGEDVERKKPDPEVYLRALHALQSEPPRAVAIEDSPAGVAAALAAQCAALVTRSFYFAEAPITGAIAVGPSLDSRIGWQPALSEVGPASQRVRLADIAHWLTIHRRA